MHAQWAMHSCSCVCYTYIINYILYRPSDKHKELLERNAAIKNMFFYSCIFFSSNTVIVMSEEHLLHHWKGLRKGNTELSV